MGVVSGVGVREEPSADGYLRGQLWNRPRVSDLGFVIFRIQHEKQPVLRSDLLRTGGPPAGLLAATPEYDTDLELPKSAAQIQVFGNNFAVDAVGLSRKLHLNFLDDLGDLTPVDLTTLDPDIGRWALERLPDSVNLSGLPGLVVNDVARGSIADLKDRSGGRRYCRLSWVSEVFMQQQLTLVAPGLPDVANVNHLEGSFIYDSIISMQIGREADAALDPDTNYLLETRPICTATLSSGFYYGAYSDPFNVNYASFQQALHSQSFYLDFTEPGESGGMIAPLRPVPLSPGSYQGISYSFPNNFQYLGGFAYPP
jgi:hypothetical protein